MYIEAKITKLGIGALSRTHKKFAENDFALCELHINPEQFLSGRIEPMTDKLA